MAITTTVNPRFGRKPHVLVVEDIAQTRLEVTAALEDYGFQAECVATGHEGLRHALDRDFDAVVDRKSTRLNSSHT